MALNLVAHSIKHGHVHKDTSTTKRLANAHNWAVSETTFTHDITYPLDGTIEGIPTEQRAIILYNPVSYTTTPNGLIITGLLSEGSKYIRNIELQLDVFSKCHTQASERFKDTCVYVCKSMQPYSLTEIGGMNRDRAIENEINIPLPVYMNTRTTSTLAISPRTDFTKHKKYILKIPDVQFLGPFDKLVAFFTFSYFGPYEDLVLQIDAYMKFEFIGLSDKKVYSWPMAEEALFRPLDRLPDAPNEGSNPKQVTPAPHPNQRGEIQRMHIESNDCGFNNQYEAMCHVGAVDQNLQAQMEEEDTEYQKRIDQATQAFHWDSTI